MIHLYGREQKLLQGLQRLSKTLKKRRLLQLNQFVGTKERVMSEETTPIKPTRPGWYWFLPDAAGPSSTGVMRIDKPVVLLVVQEHVTKCGPPARLVVPFPSAWMCVDDMSGDWEPIAPPDRMEKEARKRWTRNA